MSVVALPPHGIHVHLNNRWRSPNESAFQFRVPPLAFGINGVGSYLLQLKQVTTKNFIPNVQPNISDRYRVNVNGNESIFILAEGDYNIDALVDAMNASLATLNPGLQLSYDYDMKKLTINIPNGVTFSWSSPIQNTNPDAFYYPNPYDRFLAMIGFIKQKNIQYTGPTAITASYPVDLIASSEMNIHVQQNLNVVNTNNMNPQILACVPIEVPYGSVIAYEPIQPRTFTLNPQIIEYLEIGVCDEYGNRVNVPDSVGLQISFTLIPNSTSYE
jgi:hypothetical protein